MGLHATEPWWLVALVALLAWGCEPSTLETECRDSADCPAGYYCELSVRTCRHLTDAAVADAAAGDRQAADMRDRDVASRDAQLPDAVSDAIAEGPAGDRDLDSGAGDSGAGDSGAGDSGAADTGASDSGAADGGAADGGAADRGAVDSGAMDGEVKDHSALDSSSPDTTLAADATEARDATTACSTSPCLPGELCEDVDDGGYQCSCPGMVCDDVCSPTWRCCEDSDCLLPTSRCLGHLCAGTLVLQEPAGSHSVDDTWISSYERDTNYGSDGSLRVRTSNNHVALVRFDLSLVAPGTVVTSAELELYAHARSNQSCTFTAGVHEVLTGWEPAEATWNEARHDVTWEIPGCDGEGSDRAAGAVASLDVTALNTWYSFEIGSLAQQWVEQPAGNRGAVVRSLGGPCEVAFYFRSSEHFDASLRPRLRVSYIEP